MCIVLSNYDLINIDCHRTSNHVSNVLFRIEPGRRGCDYDRVEILELSTNTSRGSYCGSQAPEAPVSTRGGLVARLVTDASLTRAGFKLQWTTHECGGSLDSPGEIRSSPSLSPHYHLHYQCNCT